MNDIVSQVKRVADLIGEISSSAHEQTSGIEQVNQAIVQLDNVTQQNAALVEEAAAAADSLNQQAGRMVEVVSIFKLGGNAVAAPSRPSYRSVGKKPQALAPRKPAPALARPSATPSRVAAKPVATPKRLAPAAAKPAAGGNDDWETF
jgi:methyl-accepting chemotaxis protein